MNNFETSNMFKQIVLLGLVAFIGASARPNNLNSWAYCRIVNDFPVVCFPVETSEEEYDYRAVTAEDLDEMEKELLAQGVISQEGEYQTTKFAEEEDYSDTSFPKLVIDRSKRSLHKDEAHEVIETTVSKVKVDEGVHQIATILKKPTEKVINQFNNMKDKVIKIVNKEKNQNN